MNFLSKIKWRRQKEKAYFYYFCSLKSFFYWDLLHVGLDSYYKTCSYWKNKHKKVNIYRKSL